MKTLEEFINEGSWGYEPNEGDAPLDLRGDLYRKICELIYDKCEEYSKDSGCAWAALGNIEHFFEEFTKMEGFPLGDKNDSDKYYYWFRLIDKEHKNIFELYDKLLNQCMGDEKWIEDWKEPDKMRKSLEKRKKISEKYDKLIKDHIKKEEKAKLQQNTNKQAETQQINFSKT